MADTLETENILRINGINAQSSQADIQNVLQRLNYSPDEITAFLNSRGSSSTPEAASIQSSPTEKTTEKITAPKGHTPWGASILYVLTVFICSLITSIFGEGLLPSTIHATSFLLLGAIVGQIVGMLVSAVVLMALFQDTFRNKDPRKVAVFTSICLGVLFLLLAVNESIPAAYGSTLTFYLTILFEFVGTLIALVLFFWFTYSFVKRKSLEVQKTSKLPLRVEITLLNVIALGLAIPLTYGGLLLAVFSSDSGPNFIAYVMEYMAYVTGPVIIVLCVISQVRKSRTWAGWAVAAPFVPLALMFGVGVIFAIGALILGPFFGNS